MCHITDSLRAHSHAAADATVRVHQYGSRGSVGLIKRDPSCRNTSGISCSFSFTRFAFSVPRLTSTTLSSFRQTEQVAADPRHRRLSRFALENFRPKIFSLKVLAGHLDRVVVARQFHEYRSPVWRVTNRPLPAVDSGPKRAACERSRYSPSEGVCSGLNFY